MAFIIDHPEKGLLSYEDMPLYGIERAAGVDSRLPTRETSMVKFILLDDDLNFIYGGHLHDDDECENQDAALRYGEADEGATVIKVRRDGEWVQEIG